jgi:YegS/Rv2252/BmrU family lipid kinase
MRAPGPLDAKKLPEEGLLPVCRVAVIHNPVAGWRRRRYLRRVIDALRERGCEVRVRRTTAPGDAHAFAAEAEGCDVLAVAGGDGTANEALNGLAGRHVPLAVIPLGTANVLAHELGLPRDPLALARSIVEGRRVPVHLGEVNGRRFALMVGAGFDAHVVASVGARAKKWVGQFAYVLAGLTTTLRFGHPVYRVTVDGEARDAASVVVAKGRRYGGRFVVAPEARLWRPDFQVVLFRQGGLLAPLRYGVALLLGNLHRRADVDIVPATDVRIEGPAGDPVQGDGDRLTALPANIRLLRDAAVLVTPKRDA